MAPSNLQGLNLIHPESPPSNLTDTQDLLSTPIFQDFATNDLDLWSNINFASDEPFVSAHDRQLKQTETEPRADSLTRKEADRSFTAPEPASSSTSIVPPTQQQPPQFDFARFFAEFGLAANTDGSILSGAPGLPGLAQANFAAPPAIAPTLAAPPAPAPTPATSNAVSPSASETPAAPLAKRARTTKTPTPAASSSSDTSFPDPQPDLSTPLTPSEDKRRRNTAASARFRLKKKEREVALDARAHALEERVTELERECEGLRRENGWLRGLVVGVTGGVVPAMSDAPIVGPPVSASGSVPSSSTTPATTGSAEKRKRDEETT
ncbi:hypothetical protein FRC09_016232 [Ceratobasidium sp. 395]|nr:hypothetical protein FRC09_016232 [Ceratobasidium sp. 395]